MIFMIVFVAVLVLFVTMMAGRILNFFGKSSYPRNHLHVLKSKYSTASDKSDNGDKSHTFFRNCEKATTEPVTGDITGKLNRTTYFCTKAYALRCMKTKYENVVSRYFNCKAGAFLTHATFGQKLYFWGR